MATVISGAFPNGLLYGATVAPNGVWGIIDSSNRAILHITSDPTQASPAHTFPSQITKVLCDGSRWYAAVSAPSSQYQLYRSTDGLTGATWEAVGSATSEWFLAAGNGVIFRQNGGGLTLSRSADSGDSWQQVIVYAQLYAIDPLNWGSNVSVSGAGGMWAIGVQSTASQHTRIAVSTDNGATWVFRDGPPPDPAATSDEWWVAEFNRGVGVTQGVIYIDGERRKDLAGNYTETYEVYRSSDNGVTWTEVTESFPSLYGHSVIQAFGDYAYFVGVQDDFGNNITFRRVKGSGGAQLFATETGWGFYPTASQFGVSDTQLLAGQQYSSTTTYLLDLPLDAEIIELNSAANSTFLTDAYAFTRAVFNSGVVSQTTAVGAASAAAMLVSTGLVLTSLGFGVFGEVFLASSATLATPVNSSSNERVLLASTIRAYFIKNETGPGTDDAWVMNLETGGFTRYEGFNFNSYAKIGGRYYGCTDDGIYQLDGDTDNGTPIRSMVSFGKQNFGTSALKRITNAYVGTSGEGKLFLKVIAEGEEYTYAARSYDGQIKVQRFDTGKGLLVNWLEFELYNADGEDFELASVEFAVVPMGRRI